jgi:hypothetical protein
MVTAAKVLVALSRTNETVANGIMRTMAFRNDSVRTEDKIFMNDVAIIKNS